MRRLISLLSSRLLWAAGDLAVGAGAFYSAFQIRIRVPLPLTESLLPPERLHLFSAEWGVVLLSQLLMLYFLGFYDPPQPRPRLELARGLLAATALQGLLLAGYFFLADRTFPRSVLVLFIPLNLILLLIWRWLLGALHRPHYRRVALIGCGSLAQELAEAIERHHWHGLEVAGFVPQPGETEVGEVGAGSPLGEPLGTLDDLPRLLATGEIDDVVLVGESYQWQTRLLDQLAASRPASSSVLLVPGPFESLIGRMRYRWVHDIPLIEVVRETEWRLHQPVKRLFDLVAGTLLFLVSLPLLAIAALLVKLTSPGPVFYRQCRVGRGQSPFVLWKLRTMRQDAERDTGEVLARRDDPRLTPVGYFLRRFRLDEIPQLLNVLEGSMSLVGPRPERPGFVEQYLREIPGYSERFSVAPGITGLAQVNGDYHSSPGNKLRYDLAYLANWSLWLDLSILFRTVKIVLTSRGT